MIFQKNIYLTLSFDDGLVDFKQNALPLLNKYGVKASLNVVSGYLDNTIVTKVPHLNYEDLLLIKKDGHEIAVHSNTHSKQPNIQDFNICRTKLFENIGGDKYGAVIPYSLKIPKELAQNFKKNGYAYLCDVEKQKINRPLIIKLLRIINHFVKNKSWAEIVNGWKYVYSEDEIDIDFPCFDRVPATRIFNYRTIRNFLRLIKGNSYVVIMFHSVLNSYDEECDWPQGAWTTSDFEAFLSYISHNKKYTVLTQTEMFNALSKNKRLKK